MPLRCCGGTFTYMPFPPDIHAQPDAGSCACRRKRLPLSGTVKHQEAGF
ncbi:MAG TPA: hypothetical protein H9922_11910 [Candidatus Phocaeicola caecigallinarum]|nr:hypothetical protein [Candidatus Phocaeicola caecigallinarum]